MAVIVDCTDPQGLLDSIKQAINGGKVDTWIVDADGDFTHLPEQWRNLAWLRPKVAQGRLVFRILGPRGKGISVVVYAVYHGRFIEMLIAHFDAKFSNVHASAYPTEGDIVGAYS